MWLYCILNAAIHNTENTVLDLENIRGELEQSSRKQLGRTRNISVLSDMSVRNTYLKELPDWDLTVALYIYIFMIVLGVRFASSYPIYLKNKPWQRPNWRPNGTPCGDIWKNRSGRLTALGLVHSQGRGWPIIVINGGLIRVPLLNHQQHCSFFFQILCHLLRISGCQCGGWVVNTFHKTLSLLARRPMGVCLCSSVCHWGLFAPRSPHPSAGRPSLMVVEAPLLPTSPDWCYTILR